MHHINNPCYKCGGSPYTSIPCRCYENSQQNIYTGGAALTQPQQSFDKKAFIEATKQAMIEAFDKIVKELNK